MSPIFDDLLKYRKRDVLNSMGNQERFALLQELLQQPPEESVWGAICELFATWPDEREKEEALDYADAHLSHWNDTLRHVTSAWNPLYSNGEVSSLGKLMRSIRLYRREQNGYRELTRIANSSYLQNLKRLIILRSDIYGGGCKNLARSPYLHNLTHLEIHRSEWIKEDDFASLVNSPILESLAFLKLSYMDLRDEDVAALAQSPFLKRLTHLDLSQNGIGAKGLEAIAQASKFQNLKKLNLSYNWITDAEAYELVKSPYLQNLEELNLCESELSESGKNALKTAPQFQHTNIVFSQ
jgi:hypothetical protein